MRIQLTNAEVLTYSKYLQRPLQNSRSEIQYFHILFPATELFSKRVEAVHYQRDRAAQLAPLETLY